MIKYLLLLFLKLVTFVPRFAHLLKLQKGRGFSGDEEMKMKCSKCGKRLATGSDGLCNYCRFDNALTRMAMES